MSASVSQPDVARHDAPEDSDYRGALDRLFRRQQSRIGASIGLLGLAAVICGVLLLSLAPRSPMMQREDRGINVAPTASATTTLAPGSKAVWLGPPVRLWQTANGTGELIRQKADVLFVPDFEFEGPVLNVSSERGQTVAGFGGAFSEASARVFRELPLEQQLMVLEGYFGRDGIGYTLGRVDVTGNFQPEDFEDDVMQETRVQVPFIMAAHKLLSSQGKAIQLLATQMDPAPWMKTNAKMFPPAHPCLRDMVSATWAQYFVEWITGYHKQGIPIWAVTVQHESSDEDCLLTPEQEADFLGHLLGPRLRATHPNVQIFLSHHSKDRAFRWADVIRSHPMAATYAVGVAFESSAGDDLEAIQLIRKEMPKAQLVASEAVGLQRRWRWHKGFNVATGEWTHGEAYARDILTDLNVGSIAWVDWNLLINDEHIGPNHVDHVWDAAMNLLVDNDGGPEHEDNVWDAAMMADLSTGEVYRHPQYYFIGHFSKFILPGSVHLRSSVVGSGRKPAKKKALRGRKIGHPPACNAEDGLQSTSFLRPDSLVATVVLNCDDEAVRFKLLQGERAAHAYIPPHAVQTYLFEHTGSSPFRPVGQGGVPFIGVNLGGWLLLEEWMWAEQMTDRDIRDEYTLIQQHGGPTDPRAISLMQDHWNSFVTESDLDRLQQFGISHVRVPIGWWLVDYDLSDGFVDGGERYLSRLLVWLGVRGMRCVIDLHALPGAQASYQSFTGKYSKSVGFFLQRRNYERGMKAMLKLAQLIVSYEKNESTAGVVFGVELVNEPDWKFWDTSPGVREVYELMVPQIRRFLPSYRYAIFLNFMESPRTTGSAWLARMRATNPQDYEWVVYDVHMYHSYGDDNGPGREWNPYVDSCKTCCRDPLLLDPLLAHELPMVIGEFSLNTGFPGNPDFYLEYFQNQLSLWASLPGVIGSFFWNHRILRNPGGWYKEMSLLELLLPKGPLPPVAQMNLTVRCPGKDLWKCPRFNAKRTIWSDECVWEGDPDVHDKVLPTHAQKQEEGSRTHKGGGFR